MHKFTFETNPSEFEYLYSLGFRPETMTENQLFLSLIEVWFYQSCGGFSSTVKYCINEILKGP